MKPVWIPLHKEYKAGFVHVSSTQSFSLDGYSQQGRPGGGGDDLDVDDYNGDDDDDDYNVTFNYQ